MMRDSGAACRCCCGKTRSAPAIHAAYGTPHALAWNIGTTARNRSRSDSARAIVDVIVSECRYVLYHHAGAGRAYTTARDLFTSTLGGAA
jgi:hypothetical protein